MRLNEGEISAILEYEIQQAQGYDSDVLASKREQALRYYQGEMPDPAEGRSAIVSTDVADTVHSVLAQIQPILRTTLIEFVPESDQDEQMAQMETDYTRSMIDRSGGWTAINSAVHDALLIGNGWIKIETEDDIETSEELYEPDLPDEALFMLSQPTADNQDVKITSSATRTTVKRTTTTTRLKFESIPPEDMLFSEGRGIQSLQDQRFVAQRKLYTCAQLREMGVTDEQIAELPDADDIYWQAVEARQGIYGNDDGQAAQDSERLKAVYCCYIRMSMNDNNESELRYVWYNGGQVLKNEPATHVPYVTGSPIPMPHRVQGTGLFEKLASIQEGKTHILRNYMDNLDVMNSSRMGVVEGQVNMDDATSGRVNGLIRVRSPDSIIPIPSNDIGAQAIQGLDYLDQVLVQRVGSSIDFNDAQAQIMKSSATAASGQMAETEKMGGWFATNLVETMIKPAFGMVHRLLRTDLGGPAMIKARGVEQQVDTSQWQSRDVMEVNMGMTTGEKAQKDQALTELMMQQTQVASLGGLGSLVDKSKFYNAWSDWIRSRDLSDPSQYLINPDSPEAQQAEQQQAQQMQAQQAQMQQMEQQMVQMQQAFELEKQKRELEYKYYDTNLDAEVEEAKMTSSTVVDMAKLNKPESNAEAS